MSSPQTDGAGLSEQTDLPAPNLQSDVAVYQDLARLVERMHRRYLDVVRSGLLRLGAEDLGPAQALMIMLIGDDELSVRDLMERGYYLGSNASYSLKQLVEAGYVERGANQRDRRAARLRLTERGRTLRRELTRQETIHTKALVRNPDEVAELRVAFRTLRRLDRIWGDLARYSARDLD